jgi:hypothetical protein
MFWSFSTITSNITVHVLFCVYEKLRKKTGFGRTYFIEPLQSVLILK